MGPPEGKEGKEQELQDIREEIRRVDRLRKQLPSGDPFDEGYKRLFYCRFADDFAIGIIGSFADAENIRQQVTTFVQETLKLTIAEEKSHICHSKKGMITETMRQQKRSTRKNGPNRAMPKSSWLTMGNSEVWQTIMLLRSA